MTDLMALTALVVHSFALCDYFTVYAEVSKKHTLPSQALMRCG